MSYTLRFVRDEKTNDVTFLVKGPTKTRRITLSLLDMSMALMAGKEVKCKVTSPKVAVVPKPKLSKNSDVLSERIAQAKEKRKKRRSTN